MVGFSSPAQGSFFLICVGDSTGVGYHTCTKSRASVRFWHNCKERGPNQKLHCNYREKASSKKNLAIATFNDSDTSKEEEIKLLSNSDVE